MTCSHRLRHRLVVEVIQDRSNNMTLVFSGHHHYSFSSNSRELNSKCSFWVTSITLMYMIQRLTIWWLCLGCTSYQYRGSKKWSTFFWVFLRLLLASYFRFFLFAQYVTWTINQFFGSTFSIQFCATVACH